MTPESIISLLNNGGLDEELSVAAYGQRRDTWYDHTIIFHAPTA